MPPKVFFILLPIQAAAVFFLGPFHGGGSGLESVLMSAGVILPIGATFFYLLDKPVMDRMAVITVMFFVTLANCLIWFGIRSLMDTVV